METQSWIFQLLLGRYRLGESKYLSNENGNIVGLFLIPLHWFETDYQILKFNPTCQSTTFTSPLMSFGSSERLRSFTGHRFIISICSVHASSGQEFPTHPTQNSCDEVVIWFSCSKLNQPTFQNLKTLTQRLIMSGDLFVFPITSSPRGLVSQTLSKLAWSVAFVLKFIMTKKKLLEKSYITLNFNSISHIKKRNFTLRP